jgi:hypothetical protein
MAHPDFSAARSLHPGRFFFPARKLRFRAGLGTRFAVNARGLSPRALFDAGPRLGSACGAARLRVAAAHQSASD